MAFKYICDGCDKTADTIEEFTGKGHVIKGLYCGKCVKKVDEYLKKVDALHEKSAAKFNKDLQNLRLSYGDGGFVLPDAIPPQAVAPTKKGKK